MVVFGMNKAIDYRRIQVSDRWFYGFCRCHRIPLGRKTHTTEKSPTELKNAIKMFHGRLLRERRRGAFILADTANMDQTPLPFVMDDGKTYNQTGLKEIWLIRARKTAVHRSTYDFCRWGVSR